MMNWKAIWSLLLLCLLLMPAAWAQEEEAAEEAAPVGSSTYIDLKPAFVVNYGGIGRLRYLKTEIALRVTGGDKGASNIRHHMPYIRHQLVMLLSKASEEDVSTMAGRELLRQQALEAVQKILLEEEGEQDAVDLLFNSFIVQR